MYFSLDLLSIQTLLDQLLSRPSLEVTSPVTLVTLVTLDSRPTRGSRGLLD